MLAAVVSAASSLTTSQAQEAPAAWVEQGAGPAPRFEAAMATNRGGGVVMFGGTPIGSGSLGDTWTWTAGAWVLKNPPESPPPQAGHVMALHDATNKVLLVGSAGRWTWDGTNWAAQTGSGPFTGSEPRLAYHPPTKKLVLFSSGGMWAWDGNTTWTEEQPLPVGVQEGDRLTMAYHGGTRRLVVLSYGRDANAKFVSRTWTWDGATWEDKTPPPPRPSPPAVQNATMTYDANLDRVVFFGGGVSGEQCCRDDTWTWDGVNWEKQLPPNPPGRANAAMAYDPTSRRSVLFGGQGFSGAQGIGAVHGDTWTYGGRLRLPQVTGVDPAIGRTSGNDTVTVKGRDLGGALAVHFVDDAGADAKVTAFTVSSDGSEISVVTPPHNTGKVNVLVEARVGTSLDTPADDFTYVPVAVTALSRHVGSSAGKERVVVTGRFLREVTSVRFGTTAALFAIDSDDQLTAYSPPHSPGKADVSVEVAGVGTSADTPADDFVFVDPLAPTVGDLPVVPPTDLTPPSLTPPVLTPPSLTPPSLTPPSLTPPSLTPPSLTPPSLTPPSLTPPSPGGPPAATPPGVGPAPTPGPATAPAPTPAPAPGVAAVPAAALVGVPAPGAVPGAAPLPSAQFAPGPAPSPAAQLAPGANPSALSQPAPASARAASGTGAASASAAPDAAALPGLMGEPQDSPEAAPRHAMVGRSPPGPYPYPTAALGGAAALLLLGGLVCVARERSEAQPQGGY